MCRCVCVCPCACPCVCPCARSDRGRVLETARVEARGRGDCGRSSAAMAAVAVRRRASSIVGRAVSRSTSRSMSGATGAVGARRWMRAGGGDGDVGGGDAWTGARARGGTSSSESESESRWGRGAEGVAEDDGGDGRARFRSERAKAKRRLRAYRFAEAGEEATREEVCARARRARGRREIRGGYFDGWEVTGERRRGTAAATAAFASSFASSFGGRRGRGRASDEDARKEDVERAFRAYAWARLRRGGRRSAFGGDFFAADAAFREFFRAERGAGAGAGGDGGDHRARAVTAEGFYAGAACEHCETLGLRPNAFVTWDALKTAHREQAVKWHPDRHANDKSSAEIRFKRVYDAYDALIARSPTREARFE